MIRETDAGLDEGGSELLRMETGSARLRRTTSAASLRHIQGKVAIDCDHAEHQPQSTSTITKTIHNSRFLLHLPASHPSSEMLVSGVQPNWYEGFRLQVFVGFRYAHAWIICHQLFLFTSTSRDRELSLRATMHSSWKQKASHLPTLI
jgi:hypothetical protein